MSWIAILKVFLLETDLRRTKAVFLTLIRFFKSLNLNFPCAFTYNPEWFHFKLPLCGIFHWQLCRCLSYCSSHSLFMVVVENWIGNNAVIIVCFYITKPVSFNGGWLIPTEEAPVSLLKSYKMLWTNYRFWNSVL